jgi:Mn2+/Fe2+ NRAMP family transporter
METEPKKSLFQKIGLILLSVGPGLFLIGYNIGTGSVTTMAKTGANYGMQLFWALLLSCIFTYVLMVAYGQVTLVTDRTALTNVKSYFGSWGKPLALYMLIACVIGEVLALSGIMGIVTDLLSDGFRRTLGIQVNTLPITVTLVVALFALLWFGKYPEFEKVLIVFVILMGCSFLIVFLMLLKDFDFSGFAQGLLPNIPEPRTEEGSDTPALLIAGIAGTTCSAVLFIVRSTVVVEKGWKIGDLKQEKKDSFVSASMMLFLSAVIMVVAAGTLFPKGEFLTKSEAMTGLLEPLGPVGAMILILGVAGAGLSTVFPIILIAPWLICDYRGTERNIHSPMFRILGGLALLFCFGMQFKILQRVLGAPGLMVASQAFQACILPAVVIPIWILINRKEVMREHKAGKWMNFGLLCVFIFSIVTTYQGIKGLIDTFKELIHAV